ncbi:MAG: biotin attachment protein [Planctomycetes bacterium]|nr:biotin attachment protein [Planctomycetota bacterium]
MPIPVILPDLGAEDAVVRVSCWLVEPGEAVDVGDRLVEVLLPGITCDVAAPAGGVLSAVDQPAGCEVAPGEVLGWIEPDSEPDAEPGREDGGSRMEDGEEDER